MSHKLCAFLFSALVVLLTTALPQSTKYEETSLHVVGGVEAPPGFAPHMVALVFGERFPIMLCGGSIISKWLVLTAAHCIDNAQSWEGGQLQSSLRGVIGSNLWASTSNIIRFTDFKNHPEYDAQNIKNDVGVLITIDMIHLDIKAAIIALENKWVDGGKPAFVAGWGRVGLYPAPIPDRLQLLNVTTLSAEECYKNVREISTLWGHSMPIDPKLEICTFHSCGRGVCHGDSGGGLVSMETGNLIGVVSWGFPCALGVPDIFVRISAIFDNFLQPMLEVQTAEGFSKLGFKVNVS